MLKLLEDKFGQLVAKKVFLFLRHPVADVMDIVIKQHDMCAREWRESTELGKIPQLRARVGPPDFQMSYFFNYDMCKILLSSFKIDVQSFKMMYCHAGVTRKGKQTRQYWYCLYDDMYKVETFGDIQTGFNLIRFDRYTHYEEVPHGYVSGVEPWADLPPWAVNLDDAITPFFDF